MSPCLIRNTSLQTGYLRLALVNFSYLWPLPGPGVFTVSNLVSAGPGGPDDRPILIDARVAARLLSISARTLWSLTHSGKVPCVRLGRLVRYRVADLQGLGADDLQMGGK